MEFIMKNFILFLSLVFVLSCGENKIVTNQNYETDYDVDKEVEIDIETEMFDNDTIVSDISNDEDIELTKSICGNGILEEGEVCEVNEEILCSDLSVGYFYPDNKAICKNDCGGFNDTLCKGSTSVCGNGVLEEGELCELGDFVYCENKDIKSYCTNDCNEYDNTPCKEETSVCGNGILEEGELCEKGERALCQVINYSKYSDWSLQNYAECSNNCEYFDESTCVLRGDEWKFLEVVYEYQSLIIEGPEKCIEYGKKINKKVKLASYEHYMYMSGCGFKYSSTGTRTNLDIFTESCEKTQTGCYNHYGYCGTQTKEKHYFAYPDKKLINTRTGKAIPYPYQDQRVWFICLIENRF